MDKKRSQVNDKASVYLINKELIYLFSRYKYKKNMNIKILIVLFFTLFSCSTKHKVIEQSKIKENKDVSITKVDNTITTYLNELKTLKIQLKPIDSTKPISVNNIVYKNAVVTIIKKDKKDTVIVKNDIKETTIIAENKETTTKKTDKKKKRPIGIFGIIGILVILVAVIYIYIKYFTAWRMKNFIIF